MVSPALQLSVKMPENRLQVWAASLLAGTSPSPHPSPSAYPSLLVWVVSGFLSSADLYHTLGEGDKERALRQQSDSVLEQLEQGGHYLALSVPLVSVSLTLSVEEQKAVNSKHHQLMQVRDSPSALDHPLFPISPCSGLTGSGQ